jgi:hypothetical protein
VPVSDKVVISENIKGVLRKRAQDDALVKVSHKYLTIYLITLPWSNHLGVLTESCHLMCCIGDVGLSRFLKEVELSHHAPIIELMAEGWCMLFSLKNFGRVCWSGMSGGLERQFQLVDNLFDQVRLC